MSNNEFDAMNTYILDENQIILDNHTEEAAVQNVFYIQNDTQTFLVNGDLEEQPIILQDDGIIHQYCIEENSSNHENSTIIEENGYNMSSNLMEISQDDLNFTPIGDENPQTLFIQGKQFPVGENQLITAKNDGNSETKGHIVNLLDEADCINLKKHISIENLTLSDQELKKKILANKAPHRQKKPSTLSQRPDDSFKNIDISKIKGRDLTTGEPINLDTYLEKRRRKIQKDKEAAEFFEKCRKSPRYKLEKSYKELINKKIEIGKTLDGRKVVGQILNVKKTDSNIENETKSLELLTNQLQSTMSKNVEENSNYNKMFTTYDDHNFMAKSFKDFEEIGNSNSVVSNINAKKSTPCEILKNETDFDTLDLINDILEDHKYTDFKIESLTKNNEENVGFENESFKEINGENVNLIHDILEDHKYTDFKIDSFEEINEEKQDCINYEDPEDLILSSYNSLLSINVVTQHNYSRLSKNCKNKAPRSSADDRNPTETVNLHEYPKKIGQEKHPHENKKIKTDKTSTKNERSDKFKSNCNRKYSYNYCFSCAVCRRKFSRMATLEKHMQICNGLKDAYSCSFCGCSYRYISSLTRHLVQNHVEKETAKFKNDSDHENGLYFEVPATEIITEDSIILEEDANVTENESNVIETVQKSPRLGGEEMETAVSGIPILEVDENPLLKMERCNQIVGNTRSIDESGSGDFLDQFDQDGNILVCKILKQ